MPKLENKSRWGSLESVVIPKSCKNVRMMKGKPTCRVFLKYKRTIAGTLSFRVWDFSGNEEDNIWRILLTNPDPQGIYVQGVLGHKLFLEVNFR